MQSAATSSTVVDTVDSHAGLADLRMVETYVGVGSVSFAGQSSRHSPNSQRGMQQVSVSFQCDTFDFSIGTIASSMCHKAGPIQAVTSSVSFLAGILKIPAAAA